MGLGELLEEGAEDGELSFEGLGVCGAEGGAVGGELAGGDAGAVEGGDADAFAGHGDGDLLIVDDDNDDDVDGGSCRLLDIVRWRRSL